MYPFKICLIYLLKFGHFKERNYGTDTETLLEKDFSCF